MPILQALVVGPPPPSQVPVLARRPIKLLPGQVHLVGHEVGQVQVVRLGRVHCQDLPQDLVCPGPSHNATLGEQEHVSLGLHQR